MTTAAEALINAFLPVAERAVNALERWLDGAEIGIVDDQPVMVTHKRPDETIRAAGLGQPNSRVRTALQLAVAHITVAHITHDQEES